MMNRHRASKVVVRASLACLALGVACLVNACGSETPCDQALDKAESCGIEGFHLTDAGDECATFAACGASCLLKANCNDIKDTLAQTSGYIEGDCSTGNDLDQCGCHCGE